MSDRAPNIYVIGASHEAERTAEIVAYVRSLGAVVTYDWTGCALRSRPKGGDRSHDAAHAFAISSECLDAVRASDVVLWLIPYSGSTGSGFEAGTAHARGIPIVAAGPFLTSSVFHSQARVTHPEDRGAAVIAVRLATMIASGQRPEDVGTTKLRRLCADT